MRLRALASLIACSSALAWGGCLLLPAFKPAAGPAPYGAHYSGLADKRTAIVVYVPRSTVDEYPSVREEITGFLANKMRAAIPSSGVASTVIDPALVIEWQDSTFNWRNLPENEIGQHFQAERLLCIQVLDYSTRKIIGQSEMQGRLRAQCRVFEIPDAPPASQPAGYAPTQAAWTSLIDIKWPPDRPLAPTQTNEGAVRYRTLDSFSERLVGYFTQS
jgi:hypothetical protein